MLVYVPLALALALCLTVVLDAVSRRCNLALTRIALLLFGDVVTGDEARTGRQQRRMRAAHVGATHRAYAARTILFGSIYGVAGSVLGVYLVALALAALAVGEAALRSALPPALGFLVPLANVADLAVDDLFVILLVASATVGAGLALAAYHLRWWLLDRRAAARATAVDATLPRTVAFVYALSRSGTTLPVVLETLTRNRGVYGEAADELGVAVRDMNVFGTDVLTALRRVAEGTPSENMEEFAENLASVLGSGRNVSEFLREQYERFEEEARSQQRQYLELLAAFAEIYVTVFVAGPLFFVTILVVVGLVLENTIVVVRLVVYLGVPLASVGFVVYVNNVSGSLRLPGERGADAEAAQDGPIADGGPAGGVPVAGSGSESESGSGSGSVADGGAVAEEDAARQNRVRLALYDRLRPFREIARSPVETLFRHPHYAFAITAPLAALWIALRAAPPGPGADPTAIATALDGPIVEAAVLTLGGYAAVYEVKKRRVRAIEEAVPDLLERLASLNEAGMTVVEGFRRVADSEMGALTPEIRRTWADVRWGADLEAALRRLDRRTSSAAVSRTVTLVTNAMRTSDDVAPVLRIAADEARSSRRLRRERHREMLTYLVVIYVAFLVFLAIVGALTYSFFPAIETAQSVGPEEPARQVESPIGSVSDVDVGAYRTVFFHAAAIQALCSGLIAGQLGEGRLPDGAKHAAAMLVLAYAAFALL